MRCLVLSDIHSNLEAFQAVLDDAGQVDQVWCLGDVVGYGPIPTPVSSCSDLCPRCVSPATTTGPRWASGSAGFQPRCPRCQPVEPTAANTRQPGLLGGFAPITGRGPVYAGSCSPRHPIWEYIIYTSTARANFDHFDTPYCLVGHTHTPGIFRLTSETEDNGPICEQIAVDNGQPTKLGPERLIVNPGSVGQPRDGDSRASYAILRLDDMTIEHRRIPYSIEETQAKMMSHDLRCVWCCG